MRICEAWKGLGGRDTDRPLLSCLYGPEATATSQVKDLRRRFIKLVHCRTPTAGIEKHVVPDITVQDI